MTSTTKKQRRIWVSDKITSQLKEEFEASNTTVLLALKFASYSDLAVKIRERAIELLKEELQDSQNLMNQFNQ